MMTGTVELIQRVGIDTRSLSQGPAGVATYVRNLLLHLPQLDRLAPGFPANNFLWNQVRVPLAQLSRRWPLYHAPAYTAPLWIGCPFVLTVHDISYFVHDDWYPNRLDPLRKFYYRESMRRAARIIVPSHFSAAEIRRVFPELGERLRAVPLGVSADFRPDPLAASEVRERFSLPTRFILHVGDIHIRRGVDKVEAVGRNVGLPVVLVGKRLDPRVKLDAGTIHLRNLTWEELKGVYCAATVFVYPSLYEGFGLPLAEAMACGVPVVASKRASIPEVCGPAGLLVEPETEALTAAVKDVLEAPKTFTARGLDRAAELTWEKTALRTAAVYRELL